MTNILKPDSRQSSLQGTSEQSLHPSYSKIQEKREEDETDEVSNPTNEF